MSRSSNFASTIGKNLENVIIDEELLEPNIETMSIWKDQIDKFCFDYIESLNTRKCYVKTDSHYFLNVAIEDKPKSIQQIMQNFDTEFADSGTATASGHYLGYIGGGGTFPSALGDYIAAVTNKYTGVHYLSPPSVDIENSIINWVCNIFGFPEKSAGNITSGTSIASLYAIAVAREAKQITLNNISKALIYCTEMTHSCFFKSVKANGMSDSNISFIQMDERYKMIPDELERKIVSDISNGFIPFMIISNAGTTNFGSIDPLYEISLISKKYGIWHHVDAAYGGFFMLLDDERHKFSGIELADSITTDPHKTLFTPYGCGIILFRDANVTRKTFLQSSNCLQDLKDNVISPADVSVELTRHFRGLRIWLPLQLFGLNVYRKYLKEKLLLMKYFYKKVQMLGFVVGPEPELSVGVFRYVPPNSKMSIEGLNHINENLLELIKKDGQTFFSSTTINDVYWIRIAIVCFRTHLYHIDNCLEIISKCLKEIEQKF